MSDNKCRDIVENILSQGGITINGDKPYDIIVHDENFYKRALDGSLGFGESYLAGWWDCQKLDELFFRILAYDVPSKIKIDFKTIVKFIECKVVNNQSRGKAKIVGEKHYDIGNELFEKMLDKRMTYSCGYWKDAKTLDEAQEAKLELICRKLDLKSGMKVLDIGCGWGSFAKYAAEKYDVNVTGVTISKQQVELGKELCKGLPVDIRLQDYRDIGESFDRVVSVGMFEHVGRKNYKTFMKVANRCLKDDGLVLLHTIGTNITHDVIDPWTNKYIFPNGMLPSIKDIGQSMEGLFVMEDWHNFSAYYDKTLLEWHKNFNDNYDLLKDKYDERFFRMWNYYILSCAGAFRARCNQLWQIVLSKRGILGGYESIR